MKNFWLATMMVLAAGATAWAGDTVKITVDGMVCGFCAQGIEKRLKALPQTDGIYVNLSRKLVAVRLKDGQDIADDLLTKELVDAGYAVRSIERTQEPLEKLKQP